MYHFDYILVLYENVHDLLYAGHIKMLEDAKQHCDYLIVGLQTDPTIDRPEKNKRLL